MLAPYFFATSSHFLFSPVIVINMPSTLAANPPVFFKFIFLCIGLKFSLTTPPKQRSNNSASLSSAFKIIANAILISLSILIFICYHILREVLGKPYIFTQQIECLLAH